MSFKSTLAPLAFVVLLGAGCSATHSSQADPIVPAAAPNGVSLSRGDVDPSLVEPGLLNKVTRNQDSMHPSKSGQRLFISNDSTNSILVYDGRSLQKIRTLRYNLYIAEGMAVDNKGTLYVADLLYQEVEVFKSGAVTPSQEIPVCGDRTALGSDGPIDVAVDSNLGLSVICEFGKVRVFAAGASKPNKTLASSGSRYGVGVTLDKENNVYVVGGTASNCQCPTVFEYVGGKEPGKNLNLLGLSQPTKLLVDNDGNWVISDASGNVFLFHPGKHTPYRSLAVPQGFRIAFNESKTLLYVTQGYLGAFSVYQYPSLKLEKSIALPPGHAGAAALGIAVWPPAN